MVKQLTVKIILDNVSVSGDDLKTIGFSALIDILYKDNSKSSILFDTGYNGEDIEHNIKKLSIDLGQTEKVFLSHGHFDHTGGLTSALKYTKNGTTIYCHPSTVDPKILNRNSVNENYVGFTAKNRLDELQIDNKFEFCRNQFEVSPGVFTVGDIPRNSDYETVKGMLLSVDKLNNGVYQNDMIEDDMSLLVEVGLDDLVLITGCCHSGIINNIDYIQQNYPNKNIIGIIGGLQLHVAEQDQLDETLKKLKELQLKKFYPLHSSGEKGIEFFNKNFADITNVGGVGSIITFMTE